MFIVNFNTVFGSHTNHSGLSGFLNLFNGNSSSVFVMLAGMGLALMSNRAQYNLQEKKSIREVVFKRSWFLFVLGLLFYFWWPADILHFYGGYMHFAALLLFCNKRVYLIAAAVAIALFHCMFALIPYSYGWNFETLQYTGFLTIKGFLLNTFYNGWNPILPWIAYFFIGMWLGRLNWSDGKVLRNTFVAGLLIFCATEFLQWYAQHYITDADLKFYILADYLPPFLPFMLSTGSFGLMLIAGFMYIGNRLKPNAWVKALAATGQNTLTHYLQHLTLGFIILSIITGKDLSLEIVYLPPTNPLIILAFAITYFAASTAFSAWWMRKFKNGPVETLMRKITG
jgi:uncharacterized protein